MISVILYGRNDNHGYNLHKRAAISLNAIAHLLNDPADEIVFVDYNTPDDLPTFPEAIGDTLTAQAIEKLRILRVRPSVHQERYAAKTHLNALEPIARNVAIRRSNPANRWVLSTNTDMIFVPRKPGHDLTTAIGGLEDGYYHLPRFELPEGLWETLDRKDAEGMIAAAKEWGERFYLNEIIASGSDNLFDGPGDFQLFLREDLFRIGGFHEEMIRGWHLDANVARRMRILRGKVSSALDELVGYHCDHTRQATAYHKADRVENSAAIFVDNIYEAQVRDQADSWGLPEVQVEELKLGQASGARYLRALEAAVPGRLEGFLKAEYVPEAYGRLGYEPSHVLPYLLDLVSCIPSESRIGYVGARRDMFQAFATAWTAMGATEPVLVSDTAPWLAGVGGKAVPLQDWMDQTDLFIFEVGAEQAPDQSALTDEERARLWAVDYGFKMAVEADRDRQAQGAAPRRTLIINGVHNFFEPQVFASVSVTLTPFSSRIRHGYFVDPGRSRLQAAGEAEKKATALLGRLAPFNKAETDQLIDLTAALKTGGEDGVWAAAGRLGAEIEALSAAGVKGLFRGSGRPDEELLQRLANVRPSRAVKAAAALIAPEAGLAPTRLARLEDWEDPKWARLARWLFSNRAHDQIKERDRWVWERVTLAQNLLAAYPLGSRPTVLVLGVMPEAFAYALASLDCEVDIVNPRSLKDGGRGAVDWRREFVIENGMTRSTVGLADERPADFRYDAVISCQNALFADGRNHAGAVLQHAVRAVKTGGHVGFSVMAQLIEDDRRPVPESFSPALIRDNRIVDALRTLVGLELVGDADLRLTPRTFDRLAAVEYPSGAPPALVVGEPPHIETTAVFAFTKTAASDDGDWQGLSGVIASGSYSGAAPAARKVVETTEAAPTATAQGGRIFTAAEVTALQPEHGRRPQAHFGPIFDRLRPREGTVQTPISLRIPAEMGEELAATADIGELQAGGYEILVEGRVRSGQSQGELLAIGIVGAGRLLAEQVEGAEPGGMIRALVAFEVDEAAAQLPGGMRLALKGMGQADIEVSELVLR
jgi:hypothetical protein